jgi:RNA polymerase sigma factor (sigma-70 family)
MTAGTFGQPAGQVDENLGERTSHNGSGGRLHDMTGKPTFERIVTMHGPTVLRVCRAVVGADDADDAWSETFLSAMRAYPDLPADANVEAWLVTIAHRKAIDVTRKAARAAIPMASPPDATTVVDDHRLGADTELAAALRRLPPKQRQAVAYHYLGGLPYAEVAAIIGGNAGAARRAAADAITSLRRTYVGAAFEKEGTDEH